MSSLKMTFSLTSLFLIFAMAFVPTAVMAAEGGPTVTIDKISGNRAVDTSVTPNLPAITVEVTYSVPVTITQVTGADLLHTLQDGAGTTVGRVGAEASTVVTIPEADDLPAGTTQHNKFKFTLPNITDNAARKVVVWVPEGGATGITLGGTAGPANQASDFESHTLPSVYTDAFVQFTKAEAVENSPGAYDLEITFVDKDGTKLGAPLTTPELELTDLQITPEDSVTFSSLVNTGNPVFTVRAQLVFGTTEATVSVDEGFAKPAKNMGTQDLPPPDPVYHRAPEVEMTVSGLDETERTFRLSITITPQPKSDGSDGDKVVVMADTTGAWLNANVKATDKTDADILFEQVTARGGDNSYLGILKYDILTELPVELSLDPNGLDAKYKASDNVPDVDPVMATVGEAGPGDDDEENPTAEIAVSDVDVSERTFTVEVDLTPVMKDDGSAGDPIKEFGRPDLEFTGENDSEPRITVVDEDMADNSYLAELQWNALSTRNLPFIVKAIRDDSGDETVYYKDTSDPTMDAMATVGEDGTTPTPTPPPANAPAKPAAPTAVINATNDLIIDVSWTAPADGGSAITGYTLTKYGADGTVVKTFPEAGQPAITGTTFAVGPVPAADRGMSFTFTVTAMNANGSGSESDMSGAVMIPGAPPVSTNNPPEFPTGSAIADIVIWKGNAWTSLILPKATDDEGDTLRAYTITPNLPDGLRLVANDAQDRTITGKATVASEKTPYKFIATDSAGAAAELSFNITVLDPIVPTAPTAVTAMEEGDLGFPGNINRTVNSNKVVTNWTAPVDTTVTSHVPAIPFGAPVTGYMVHQSDDLGNPVAYPPTGADAIMKDDRSYTTPTKLEIGMYDFEVTAVNDVGEGAKSTPKAEVTVADPPGIPTDLSAALIPNTGHVTLSWRAPVNPRDGRTIDDGGSPITGYRIQIIQFGRVHSTQPLPATPTAALLTDLPAGQYVFRVIAVNADGASQPSTDTEPPTIVPAVVQPLQLPPTARIDTTITLPAMTIPANGFVVLQRNPTDSGIYPQVSTVTVGLANLDHLFRDRGGMALRGNGTGAANDLVFSEIMWGSDSSLADDSHSQWIELYNTTKGPLQLSNYRLEFYSARIAPTPGAIDEINTLNWGSLHGQRGRTRGEDTLGRFSEPVEIISMYLKINYPRVEHSQARADQLKDFPNGSAHGHWATSARPSLNIAATWRLATPGMKPRFTIHDASSVTRGVIISEIGNSGTNAYDWFELYNTTDGEVNLKKWQLSRVTDDGGKGKEVALLQFPDNDNIKIPAKSFLVIAASNPRDDGNDLAAGIDITKGAVDQPARGLGERGNSTVANYAVLGFSIPNDSKRALFILRNAHGNLGKAANLQDVIGTLSIKLQGPVVSGWTGYDANNEVYYNTSLWPLHATGAPHGNVIDGGDEDFRVGKVYQRNNFGGGTGEKHLAVRGYTGIGYDRHAAVNNENGGTPGYSKDAVKGDKSDWANQVTISEVMLVTEEGAGAARVPRATRLPQWFEIYNASLTEAVSINNWYLEIQNDDTPDFLTNLHGTLRLPNVIIQPNQTVLVVSNSGLNSGNFPEQRTINVFTNSGYRAILGLTRRGEPMLNPAGFYIEIRDHKGNSVDEIGNLGVSRRTGAGRRDNFGEQWEMPSLHSDDGHRTSLIRIYDEGIPRNGLADTSWILASNTSFRNVPSLTYYGNHRDFGTPGYRGGGPLPVSLSKFRPERLESGDIVIRWVTESELNNAGFNILRTEKRDGQFTKINTQLILGQGTTSEKTTYEWKDTTAKPNVVYYYQIQDVSIDGQTQTLRVSRLKGNVSAAGKLTTTWGALKALQ